MGERQPSVYVVNGDDEFAQARFVAALQAELGDAATASMNTTRLEGRSLTLAEFVTALSAVPFLAPWRLIILAEPLAFASNSQNRAKLVETLQKIPPATRVVLVENRLLTEDKDRRAGRLHWLEKWAEGSGGLAVVKTFILPRGAAMQNWVTTRVKALGGRIETDAARRLVELLGDDPRLAEQEIQKLLAYVNFARPIQAEDVENLTIHARQSDIFALVDAMGEQNFKQAQALLHNLLKTQEALYIFAMIVRQFRLLLQTRELLDSDQREAEIARELKIHPYVAGKVAAQARRFPLASLEAIYRRLLDFDEAIKSGEMDDTLALDLLVIGVTN